MHEHQTAACAGDQRQHPGIQAAGADVVDGIGALGQCRSGCARAHRVDGQRQVGLPSQQPEYGQQARLLDLFTDRLGAGSRRLGPQVEQVGTLGDQAQGQAHRGLGPVAA